MNRPVMSGPGLYDPTSIMNADELYKAQREGWFKLAFYLLSFFYYLYRYGQSVLVREITEIIYSRLSLIGTLLIGTIG